MSDITTIEQFPVDTSGPWNPATPVQAWHDPAAAAAVSAMSELATVAKTYTTWAVDTSGNVTFPAISTTLGAAAVQNVPSAAWLATPGNTPIAPTTNPPIDLMKIPTGYQVESNVGPMAAFGQKPLLVPVVPIPAPVPAGTDPTEARILAGEEELLKSAGDPLV